MAKFIDAAGLQRLLLKSNQTVVAPNLQITQTLSPRRNVLKIIEGNEPVTFVQIGNSVSTADRAVNDADGNSITATYATKDELAALEATVSTNALTVGSNISVDENGKISLTASNVTGALDYTPLSESNAMSNAEIDAVTFKK